MNRIEFPSLPLGVTQTLAFDFTSLLATGETISGTPTCAAALYSGTDTSPSSLISGTATVSGAVVSQKVATTGRTEGATYTVTCTAVTSASQTLKLSGFLVLVSPVS